MGRSCRRPAAAIPGSARTGTATAARSTFEVASTRATRIELWIYGAADRAARRARVELEPATGNVWSARVAASDLPADDLLRLSRVGPELAVRPGVAAGQRRGLHHRRRQRRQPDESEQARVRSVRARALARSDDRQPRSLRDRHAPRRSTRRRSRRRASCCATTPADIGTRPARPLARRRSSTRSTCAASPKATRRRRARARTRAPRRARRTSPTSASPRSSSCRSRRRSNDRNDVDPDERRPATTTGATRRSRTSRPIAATPAIARRAARRASCATMVAAFHDAGIKVYVDVVYNHTAEGGGGSLLSLRGLDNAGYYQLDRAGTGLHELATASAPTSRRDKPLAHALVLDSLRYWRDDARRRRLPLRSRAGARQRVRPRLLQLRRPTVPAAIARRRCPAHDADRRAVGRRRRQLPGRQLPGGLVGVERQVPRRDPRGSEPASAR